MKILVTSDLHLSDKIWKHRPIYGDSYFAWKQVYEIAIEEQVDLVILAGDVLDKQVNNAETVSELYTGLIRLRSAKIPVLFIQGQHDFQPKIPWISTVISHTSHTWLQPKELVELESGWILGGTDYLQEEEFQAYLKSPEAMSADILVCHQVWKDFMGDVGKPQACFDDVPSNVKCLITGDFHETICRMHNDMLVLSPGSTHLRSLSEPAEKSVFILELGERGTPVKVSTIELASRGFYTVRADKQDELKTIDELSGYLENHNIGMAHSGTSTPIFYVIHKKDQLSLVQTCNKMFADKAHMFYKVIKDDVLVPDELELHQKVTLLDCLDSYVDKEQDKEAYQLALSLLNSSEPALVLNQWMADNI